MKLIIVSLAILFSSGCIIPDNGWNNNRGKPPAWIGVCKLRPVIVTSGNASKWDASRVQRYTRWLNPGYRNANLTFEVLQAERFEKPEWFVIGEKAEFYAMSEESMRRARDDGEMAVWFVDSIPVWSAAGVAQKPSNALGKYQHGTAISANSNETTLMHELGHAFNLSHTWSDQFTDTPTRYSKDCSTEPCNAMTYCLNQRLPSGRCLGRTFSKQQVAEVQKWANAYPRNQVVNAKNVPPGAVVRYTNNTDPEID